jgi:hypothetical protein
MSDVPTYESTFTCRVCGEQHIYCGTVPLDVLLGVTGDATAFMNGLSYGYHSIILEKSGVRHFA